MANEPSPKHGSSPKTFPDRDKKTPPEDHGIESQADGTAGDAPRVETQSEAQDSTESASGEWEDVEKELPPNPTMDSAGEVGEPSGRGTLDVDPEVFEEELKKKADECR